MTAIVKKLFRFLYYLIYGAKGKNIRINNESYSVSAHVARGINNTIDETPLKLLTNLCRNADVLFDIGGNIGVIAMILAKKMKKGAVIYSFEPAPLSYKYLADTARVQDGNAKIIPVNNAVSNKNDKLYFTNNGNSCTNHISAAAEKGTISVDAITIDAFCKKNNVVPQVMKIDVEGAEFWALEGMKEILKANDCKVLVEIHRQYLLDNNIDDSSFAQLVNATGYKTYNVDGNEIDSSEIINNACVILSKTFPGKEIFQLN